MRQLPFYIAVIGWVLGLTVHLLAVSGYDVAAHVPAVWVLHLGIFAAWLPAILMLRREGRFAELSQSDMRSRMNPIRFFNATMPYAPTWVKVLAIAGFYYAILNFFLFFIRESGTAVLRDGRYLLESHGQFIRNLSEAEYHRFRASEVRGFSGHWIAFYGMAAAILYPFGRGDGDLADQDNHDL